jgi:hypothetical protein
VIPAHYRPHELPLNQRDFPRTIPAPGILHGRDTRLLLLMVLAYLLAMLGGAFLLHALSPVTHATTHATETEGSKVSIR